MDKGADHVLAVVTTPPGGLSPSVRGRTGTGGDPVVARGQWRFLYRSVGAAGVPGRERWIRGGHGTAACFVNWLGGRLLLGRKRREGTQFRWING